MEEEKEGFLSRWSRLKRAEATEAPALAPGLPPAAELPPLDTLDFSSDFSGFLQPRVEESLKRAALKKLFHSGHFNRMDGLDVYIEDYNKFEPIPEEMLGGMLQARGLFASPEEAAPTANPPEALAEEDALDAGREETLPATKPPEAAAG